MISSILVVDDDSEVLCLASCFLRQAGVEIHCAENGAQALEKIRTNNFSVMITDYNMPGMNGLDLAVKAREIAPRMRVIMATGSPSPELFDQAAGAGIAKVIAKPLRLEGLLELIK
ncbi:MAG TPA: response regulator [Geobacteraceae bacterium]